MNAQLKMLRLMFSISGRVLPDYVGRRAVTLFYSPRRFTPARWEKAVMDTGVRSAVRWRDTSLDVTRWGSSNRRVLLVHGWEGRASQMGKFVEPLRSLGYEVIAFDGPAHGASSLKRTTLPDFADAVRAVAEEHGPMHAVISHSFGAAAAAIAIQRGVPLERLVLISPPFCFRNVVSRFASFLHIPNRAHESMYPVMETLHRCTEHDLSFDSIGPAIGMPTLVIHDEDDRYVPQSEGHRVYQEVRYAHFRGTSGLGHNRILADPAVVTIAVDFVSDAARPETVSALHERETS